MRLQLGIALRALLRQPSFLATAVVTLALGIAAPTALYAVVQATLLRPLPYVHADEIYTVRTAMTDGRFTIGLVASEELAGMRRATDLVTASAMVYGQPATLAATDAGTEAREVSAVVVSEGFFDLFGVPMAQGRPFTLDDHKGSAVPAAVISGRLWRNVFGANPEIINQRIALSIGPVMVVGVAPDAFDAPHAVDIWLAGHFPETIGHAFDVYVRLKPGVDPATVSSALRPMWDGLAAKYPDQAKNRIFTFRPLLASVVGDLGPTALIAFAATALLLLLAIANVGNLMLARGASRARDLAVRVALGARRVHLIQQLLAEGLVIAVGAAAVGLPLAFLAIRTIVAVGGRAMPRVEGLRFDSGVALFATSVMVLAGVVVGLLPALVAADTKVASTINESGRAGMQSPRTRWMLAALVVSEVTLAVALVAGAGRLILSAQHLLAVDPGFQADQKLIVDALLPPQYYPLDRNRAWIADATRHLIEAGASAVGVASTLPLRHEWDATSFTDIVGHPVDPQFRPNARVRLVSRDFFRVMGIRLIAGREFTADDRADSTPVVVVNQAWANKFLPGQDPLREHLNGLTFRQTPDGVRAVESAIVGVVADVRYAGLDRDAEPVAYLVTDQRATVRLSFVITAPDGHPERLIASIRDAMKAFDPAVPIEFDTMRHVVETSLVWSRLGIALMSTFGVVSLLLAGTGVFGMLAYVGAQRHGEMAVRLTLGATRGDVFRLMLAHGGRLAVAGGVCGVALAWGMGRLMTSYVYQVSASSVVVLAGSALLVVGVALVATLAPARRAARVSPARSLRGA